MLVLHAAIDRDSLLLWGERALDVGGDDGVERAGSEHPYAAATEQLREAIGAVAVEGAAGSRDVALPTRGKSPVPSSAMLGDLPPSRAQVRMKAWHVPVLRFPTAAAPTVLAACVDGATQRHGVSVDAGIRVLARGARFAASIVLRQQFLPVMVARQVSSGANYEGRWTAVPTATDRDRLEELAGKLPASVSANAVDDGKVALVTRQANVRLLGTFVDGCVDGLVRTALDGRFRDIDPRHSLHDRWLRALTSVDPEFDGPADAMGQLADDIDRWQHRARRAVTSPFRLCFRLEEPPDADVSDYWYLRYLVQVRDELSVLIDLRQAWMPTGPDAATLRGYGFHTGEHLLAPLGDAARLCEDIEDSLRERTPVGHELTTAQAHAFLAETAPLLEQAGFGVFVPAWWRNRRGRFQLNMRAQVRTQLTGGRQKLSSLNLASLVSYDWQLAIGDIELSRKELSELAAQKQPLVRVRGKWVELDTGELAAALDHMRDIEKQRQRPPRIQATDEMSEEGALSATIGELVGMSVGGGRSVGGIPVGGVTADGDIAMLLEQLTGHETPLDPDPPDGLLATLRPYQLRGYAWLAYMAQLGLGACLADDMGLGKSVQTLAAIQRAWDEAGDEATRRPSLIVAPTSVVTNWLRECERFTPDLPILVHHGSGRLRGDELCDAASASAIMITSYGLLGRDVDDLQAVPWRLVVLDEAQNIRNPGTQHARAARALVAPARYALTGTPIENNVGDLWSIMEFLNPGLLGSQVDFRRKYMIPIQTGNYPEAGERLRRLTAPFLLRRVKTDRTVISDLPDKFETKVFCTLTAEQVSLYEAVVRETQRVLAGKPQVGIDRRGTILATLSKLKQVCNHPAHFLGDNSSIADRSGKLARLEAMLEEVLELDERALVFSQFVGMGELLQRRVQETFGREVLFLHGGVSRRRRDQLVERFQDPVSGAPPILVLSLKAGGSGLNLTAANHVFHFDRWWNPATEQQASDRAFRIGQTRDVQVHSFVCAGTVEEKIDLMIEQKKGVAASVVGAGEQWITELGDGELLNLLQLRTDTLLQPGRLDHTGREWKRARRV